MLRLAIAQLRPHKGAYEENLCRLGALFREAGGWAEPPDLVVGPETALTGYFLEGGVRDLAISADQLFDDLARQHRDAKAPPFDVALGFYEVHQNRLYNSAIYARLGDGDAGIRHVHRKVFLPTYGVFDEERFVEAGRSVQAFDTAWGRAAILICEDAWHSFTPMLAALDGAQLIIVPSASPARGPVPGEEGGAGRPASLGRWSRIVQDIAGEHGVFVALAQLVGFEGGKAFPGGSIVATPRGELVVQGPVFEEALIPATIDFEEITRARADLPLLADLEMRLPHLLGSLHAARRGGAGQAGGSGAAGRRGGRAGKAAARRRRGEEIAVQGRAKLPPAAPRTRRPAGNRPRSHPALAGRVSAGRGPAAPRIREGRDRTLGRGGQLGGRVPRRGGARHGERAGRPDALSDLEPGEPGARPAGHRLARHRVPHGRYQRRGGRPRLRDRRAATIRPAWATSWPGPA